MRSHYASCANWPLPGQRRSEGLLAIKISHDATEMPRFRMVRPKGLWLEAQS